MSKYSKSINISDSSKEEIAQTITGLTKQGYKFEVIYSFWEDIERFNGELFVVDHPMEGKYIYLEK